MKNSSKILILAIFLVFICCVSAASAAENDNSTTDSVSVSDDSIGEVDDISEDTALASVDEVNVDEKLMDGESGEGSSDEGYVIYVGTHNKTETGNGSYENPFSTLKLACDNISGQGKDKVTLNVFEGTYFLGDYLKFDTNNLVINGLGDNVIITNLYSEAPQRVTMHTNMGDSDYPEEMSHGEAFGLTSSNGNFTVNNIVFDCRNHNGDFYDYSECTIDYAELHPEWGLPAGMYVIDYWKVEFYFLPFYGGANICEYVNCSFLTGNNSLGFLNYTAKYNNCYFEMTASDMFMQYCIDMSTGNTQTFLIKEDKSPIFNYCSFNLPNFNKLDSISLPSDVCYENMWFGENNAKKYTVPPRNTVYGSGAADFRIPLNRYAVFSVYQNYLGNNTYEIIGKLTWNGTDDQDGMENFQPMTVKLTSKTGNISSTATLVNGNFRTTYNSTNANHKINYILDNVDEDLEFTTVNITANPVSIFYGEDQNITFNFTQPITANVTITVSNGSYNKSEKVEIIGKDSFIYTVPDTLKAGTYDVEINLAKDNLFGFNTTTLTVSKVSVYAFDPVIPSESKVGDDVVITVELPSDANGTVTVYVNNKPFPKEASANTEITVTGLVAGDNNITVEYSGNDKYTNKSAKQTITAEKVSTYDFDVVLPNGTVRVGEDVNITIKLPGDVNGTATVYVGTQDGVVVPVNSDSTIVPISGLVAGNNTIKVVFGDGKYVENTVTKNLTVEKVPVEITNNTIVVNTPTGTAAPTISFNLPNATGKLTVTVKGKTYTKELVNGTATVTITDLPAGTYDATVTYSGDDKFDSITTTTKITVNEAKKTDSKTNKVTKVATKIVAKNKKFKAKTKVKKYTITLKAGKKPVKKVQVTIKIGKKTYKAKTNAKGKATFKIKKLTKKGKYKATIKFKGNNAYKATSKKVKITIK